MKVKDLGAIEAIPPKESDRYNLNAVWYDAEKGRVVATDGHCLVIAKAEPDKGDVSGYVPIEAIRDARRRIKASNVPNGVQVSCNGTVDVIDLLNGVTTKYQRPNLGNYPNYEAVFPPISGPPTIVINAELLLKVAKAVNPQDSKTWAVAIWIDGQDKAMKVMGSPDGPVGIVMPLRATDNWNTVMPNGVPQLPPAPTPEPKQLETSAVPKKAPRRTKKAHTAPEAAPVDAPAAVA